MSRRAKVGNGSARAFIGKSEPLEISISGFPARVHRVDAAFNTAGWVTFGIERGTVDVTLSLTIAEAEQLVTRLREAIPVAQTEVACAADCNPCGPWWIEKQQRKLFPEGSTK